MFVGSRKRNIRIIVVGILISARSAACLSGQDNHWTKAVFYFVDAGQEPYEAPGLDLRQDFRIWYEIEGTELSFSLRDIKEIRIVEWETGHSFIGAVTTKDGTTVSLSPGAFYKGVNRARFLYTFYYQQNPASKKMERKDKSIMLDKVSRIVFDEELGRVKRCPDCGGYFPADYIFCPFTGTELVWGSLDPEAMR